VCPDGDPARLFFDLESPRPDHRDRSLCRQAQEVLLLALSEAVDDPCLDSAWVSSVDPAPGPGRRLVSVVLPKATSAVGIEDALAALVEMRPWLRSEVTRAICRLRPLLVYKGI
jgi:hypothetical protein